MIFKLHTNLEGKNLNQNVIRKAIDLGSIAAWFLGFKIFGFERENLPPGTFQLLQTQKKLALNNLQFRLQAQILEKP